MHNPQPKPIMLWKPNTGPQTALVNCPVFEVLFGGARGGGKTEGMLGDWLLHQSRYAADATGVFFRRTLPQLEPVIERARKLFALIGAEYNIQSKTFKFPNGALLKFRYLDSSSDAENYQGHEYTRLYFEEVTNWSAPDAIDMLRACLRSSAGVPCRLRMTGNPGGVGHSWVKQRFIDAAPPMSLITDQESGSKRVFIPSKLEDNPHLDPVEYVQMLKQVGSPELVRAWREGDWNVSSGAFLAGLFSRQEFVIKPFDIPAHWVRWRSMDWGFAAPYCVLWYAQDEDGNVYVYRELYGIEKDAQGNFKPNKGSRETAKQVAKKIVKAEAFERSNHIELLGSTADPAIWSQIGTELSIEEHFRKNGVTWHRADAGRGSRVLGAHEVIRRLRERSLFIFDTCTHLIRTLESIPTNTSNPEDVDTDAEDHAWDTLRYGLRRRKSETKEPNTDDGVVVGSFDYLSRL